MARMNISIPDPLYERLDRLRDRVNASKVCAQALEKELDMLEGSNAVGDPDISQLIQRLQGARDRWYQRGRQDGRRWAVQSASREELWRVMDEYGKEPGEELAVTILHHQFGPGPWFPAGADPKAAINDWVRSDLRASDQEGEDVPSEGSGSAGTSDISDDFRRARADVDEASYMEGWRDQAVEIWKAVSPALRR